MESTIMMRGTTLIFITSPNSTWFPRSFMIYVEDKNEFSKEKEKEVAHGKGEGREGESLMTLAYIGLSLNSKPLDCIV
jgi:hypothetical protein